MMCSSLKIFSGLGSFKADPLSRSTTSLQLDALGSSNSSLGRWVWQPWQPSTACWLECHWILPSLHGMQLLPLDWPGFTETWSMRIHTSRWSHIPADLGVTGQSSTLPRVANLRSLSSTCAKSHDPCYVWSTRSSLTGSRARDMFLSSSLMAPTALKSPRWLKLVPWSKMALWWLWR